MKWNKYPLFRFFIPFISGIILAISLQRNVHIPLFVFACLFTIVAFLIFFGDKISVYRYRWLAGLVLNILVFLSGFELTVNNVEKYNPLHFCNIVNSRQFVIAEVLEPIEGKGKSDKTVLKIKSVKTGKDWIDLRGKVMAYFEKDSLSENIKYGDCLLLDMNFQEVKPPQNPHEFNYKKYLENKRIYHQAYIKSGTWKFLKSNEGNVLFAFAYSLRDKLLKIFQDNGIEGQEYAVTSALILGYDEKIDPELIKQYAGTGAMHILSVSGLHVGIIYIVLNFLLSFLEKNRYGKIFKNIFLVLLIWFYALLTGLSPPVLRSAAMISFVIIGDMMNRHTNIYNTLLASALLLIIINPYVIRDVGFQLSYIAVFGIVAIQPGLNSLWLPDNWLLNKIWAITTVSIAAQLATFPLGLFYFHQFPNYFLITNLIVIPLSSLLIYSGILVLLSSFFSWLSMIIADILIIIVKTLNFLVKYIENLPFAVLRGISVNTTEMILIYLIILALIVFFIRNNKMFLKYALMLMILLSLFSLYKAYNHNNQRRFIVYNVGKSSVYDFISGNKNILFADSLLLNNVKKQDFHLRNNWICSGLKNTVIKDVNSAMFFKDERVLIYKRNNFIQFGSFRIVIVNNNNFYFNNESSIKADVLILADNVNTGISELLKQYKSKKIIIDSSCSYWKMRKWKGECKKLNIECYSVSESGSYVLNF